MMIADQAEACVAMMTTLHTVPIEERAQLWRASAHIFSFAHWKLGQGGAVYGCSLDFARLQNLLEAVRLTIPRN
jgi:hypothetical protein